MEELRATIVLENLKPCPFCGGKAHMGFDPGDWHNSVMIIDVSCTKCHAGIGKRFDYSFGVDNAVYVIRDMWNRRTK